MGSNRLSAQRPEPLRDGKFFGNEHGVSLVIVLALILLIAIIGTTVVSLVGTDTRGSGNQVQALQAFYIAEAGLELALGELTNAGDGNISNAVVGYGTVSVTNSGDTLLTATSTVGSFQKSIQVKIQTQGLPRAFYYAFVSYSSTHKVDVKGPHPKSLTGPVFTRGSPLTFESGQVLTNVTAYVTNSATVTNNTGYSITIQRFDPSSPPVSFPSFSTTYYDNYINNAGGYPDYGDEIEDPINLTTFPDSTLWAEEDLEIEADVTGPGIIACSEGITIKDGVTIGNGVQIIAGGDLVLKRNCSILGSGSVLYSSSKVEVKKQGSIIYGSLLSPTFIEIDSDPTPPNRAQIYGIIYSADKAKIRHVDVYGSIVADYFTGDELHCTNLSFDESYLPPSAPPGFTGRDSVWVVKGTWKEL